jgi:hypothetical protein
LAPAEKFGASLQTTSAAKVGGRFFDASLEHLNRVTADGVHLRMELDGQHAVVQVDEACAGVALDHLFAIPGALEQLKAGRGGWQRPIAESVTSCLEQVGDEGWRISSGRRVDRGKHFTDADRVPDLEGRAPTESPPHRAVHIVDGMGGVWSDAGGIEEQRTERRSQKRADVVAAEKQRLRPLRHIFDRSCGVDRRKTRRLPWPVRERRRIQRENL